MEMEFILYVAIYRLAIIAAGVACVYMGYRLFVLGVMPREGSDIDASAGEIRLSLKNAAPGTCFAAFGAILVAIMLWQGNPEYTTFEKNAAGAQREVSLRSDESTAQEATLRRGRAEEEKGRLDAAITIYASILSDPKLPLEDAAEPLFRIASIYHRQQRYGEALAYARLSAQVSKTRAPLFALIARIERDAGNKDSAIAAMTRAVELDPSFRDKLNALKEQINE